jgi:hypothetical protein
VSRRRFVHGDRSVILDIIACGAPQIAPSRSAIGSGCALSQKRVGNAFLAADRQVTDER